MNVKLYLLLATHKVTQMYTFDLMLGVFLHRLTKKKIRGPQPRSKI